MTEALFRIWNAKKWYRARIVLDIEDLVISRRDRILVLGENGSGKSTLFRVLIGVTKLTRGKIYRSALAQSLRLGYLPQSGGVYEDMTLRQNIRTYCKVLGSPVVEAVEDHWFVKDTVLGALLDMPIGTFSGGTKRLAALACIIAAAPHVLILDEPTSELDGSHSRHVYAALERLADQIDLLVLSTHDEQGHSFVTRTVRMTRGQIIEVA